MSDQATSPESTPASGSTGGTALPPATQPPPSESVVSSPPTSPSTPALAPPSGPGSDESHSTPPYIAPTTSPPNNPSPPPPPQDAVLPPTVPPPPVAKPPPLPQEVASPPPVSKLTPPAPIVSTPPIQPTPIVKTPPPSSPIPSPPKLLPPPVIASPLPSPPKAKPAPMPPMANMSGKPSSSTPPDSHHSYSPTHSDRSSSPSSSSSSNTSADVKSTAVVGFAVATAGVLIAVAVFYFLVTKKRKSKRNGFASGYQPPQDGYYHNATNTVAQPSGMNQPSSPAASGSPFAGHAGYGYHPGSTEPTGSKSSFTYEELKDVTNGFSRENLLGEGGFGCVYKGFLPDGRNVAVKQLKIGGGQVEREFRAEVETISRVHHRHLVSLVGYCVDEQHRMLVFEFVPNKTLEHHLHGKGLPVMDWPTRMKIAIGSAKGLAYLHEDCHPRIIHRDIKSANILLDNSFEAQVADFGLARITNDACTHVSTRVMGTFGYMAPEYATSGKLTDRSDVFSFGVVLLELITGRKPIDSTQPMGDESLVEWARPLLVRALETREYKELADPRLENNFVHDDMSRMIEAAAACVRHSAAKRPRMVQVLRALDNNRDMPDLSNGVKFGQSTVYDSSQYSADIQNFRNLAFGTEVFTEEYGRSGEHD